jgi:hypothetical protein
MVLGAFIFVIGLGIYILEAFAFFMAFRKAGVHHAWLAFIPIAQLWPYMRVIKKSAWNLLWLLVPIVDVVFVIIWQARFLKAFGISRWWLLLYIGTVIPGVNYAVSIAFIVIYCIIGFSASRQYNPNFDVPPSLPPGFSV